MKTKRKLSRKIITVILALVLAAAVIPTLTACPNPGPENENTPLMLSVSQPEGVFSPFFAGTGMDNQVTSVTQASMISTDRYGHLAFGPDHTSIARDLSIRVVPDPTRPGEQRTIYQFVLKPGIYFSDGTPLTMDDVLFNLYMLLDPVYIGMSTLNSVDILGLRAYRLQNPYIQDEEQYRAMMRAFNSQAQVRLEEAARHLRNPQAYPSTPQIQADIALAIPIFDQELDSIWYSTTDAEVVESRREQYYDIHYGWESFLLSVGNIFQFRMIPGTNQRWQAPGTNFFEISNMSTVRSMLNNNFTKENVVRFAREAHVSQTHGPNNLFASFMEWRIGGTVRTHIAAEIMTEHFRAARERGEGVSNISGIQALDGRDFVASSESLTAVGASSQFGGYEMLQVTINDVNPMAIWLLGFAVAPMHHYSQPALVSAARAEGQRQREALANGETYMGPDGEGRRHFGVQHGEFLDFMMTVMDLNRLPMGAGPYMMADANGNTLQSPNGRALMESGFFTNNVIHFVRNPYFYRLNPEGNNARIRMLRFQVVEQANILNALAGGTIHFADPSATADSQRFVNERGHLASQTVQTNGYGYVGISAAHIPYLRIRRAIMAAMRVEIASDFFPGGLSVPLHRGVSLESWIWRDEADEFWHAGNTSRWAPGASGDVTGTARQAAVLRHLLGANHAGGDYDPERYGVGPAFSNTQGTLMRRASDGRFIWSGSGALALDFTFEVAGNSQEHPAFLMFLNAADLLNGLGANITVRPNPRVLAELIQGQGRPVWAAAWGGGVDPCMFSLWHPDSTASAVRNWGIHSILFGGTGTPEEIAMVNRQTQYIEASRRTKNQIHRRHYIRQALNLAVDLAVELPTYNRSDMFVWNNNFIDSSTLYTGNQVTAFWGPMARIWNVSFIGN
ncbi:MAG: hypothetical protein FWE13_03110 [Firmicutes bacterium]|nr:hypothetical protein [Bacillota bacterium]